jgi:hypothetical protein
MVESVGGMMSLLRVENLTMQEHKVKIHGESNYTVVDKGTKLKKVHNVQMEVLLNAVIMLS